MFDSSKVDKSFEGLYTCTVSNAAGKTKSEAARLTLGKSTNKSTKLDQFVFMPTSNHLTLFPHFVVYIDIPKFILHPTTQRVDLQKCMSL